MRGGLHIRERLLDSSHVPQTPVVKIWTACSVQESESVVPASASKDERQQWQPGQGAEGAGRAPRVRGTAQGGGWWSWKRNTVSSVRRPLIVINQPVGQQLSRVLGRCEIGVDSREGHGS